MAHSTQPPTALLFSGQGSQYVGMGHSLYQSSQPARVIFDRADDLLGYKLSALCFEGPEELLRQTRYTQPALFVHEAAILAALGNPSAHAVAGHSLGEYTALYAAGAFDFDSALRLVALRGELMFTAGIEQPGAMAAVIGLDDATVEEICATATGTVVAANYNAPGQVVISGDRDAVQALLPRFKEAGARMVTELPVSGAFHSPLMAAARARLEEAILHTPMQPPRVAVYMNVTGTAQREIDTIRRLLIEQLTAPVRWTAILRAMYADGIRRFVEIGPRNVLQGLVKRTLGSDVEIAGIDTEEDLRNRHHLVTVE
ncbi:MAG: malonyl CoA-acyl carrier protein transacylase [Candidatus Kapaibacterium sp.]|jgi:[acyl-carrier-protein] S-malonyltransferase|nr:MAG: malonyl CoA-acyl carrier protein transacylase [Candidatus Kapabacteria bacterium]